MNLSDLKQGVNVKMTCPSYGCGGVELSTTLGHEEPPRNELVMSGRFEWFSPARFFDLDDPQKCPVCSTRFTATVAFTDVQGGTQKIVIFGHHRLT